MNRSLLLFLILLALRPLPARAGDDPAPRSRATLTVEYGLDSLERRTYRPVFHFDFPYRGGEWFAEVQYISRMNGALQGTTDYWVEAGLRQALGAALKLELRLNHFCRHETLRDTGYVWNLNELLAGLALERENVSLALRGGPFVGGSEGYRWLLAAGGEWRGALFPGLSLFAELKLVDLSRLYHEAGFFIALSRNVDLFFKNARHYQFPNMSYIGLRYRSGEGDGAPLDTMKLMAGVSPFDKRFKLTVEGEFRLDFFRNDSRRVCVGADFETPILNGDGFFSQFWPARMAYMVSLDYERRIAPRLFVAWVNRYRLALPVDKERPFTASLFTGLALRNQPDFDALERPLRYELAAGYNFKRGVEFDGKLGMEIWGSPSLSVVTEMKAQVDGRRASLDLRLLASTRRRVQVRPYLGLKKDFQLKEPGQDPDARLLFGLGFFRKF